MSEKKYIVGSSPHVRHPDTVQRIMWTVLAALAPAAVGAVYFFGFRALEVMLLSMGTAVVTEAVIQRVRGMEVTVADGSALVTGLLYAMVLPPNAPWYVVIVGAGVAIGIGKQVFGGLGYNIWNPALVGRAFVHFSFPVMNQPTWPMIFRGLGLGDRFWADVCGPFAAPGSQYAEAVTRATPLATPSVKALMVLGKPAYSLGDLFWGYVPGCLGEVSAFLLLIGGVVLVARRLIRWYVPVIYIGLAGLLLWMLPYGKNGLSTAGWFQGDFLYQIFAGGLFLGAIFMATDMVTSPLTGTGQVIFAAGCAVLTALIRLYGGYPEGVCYSILLMNCATPFIDRVTRPRTFGTSPRLTGKKGKGTTGSSS